MVLGECDLARNICLKAPKALKFIDWYGDVRIMKSFEGTVGNPGGDATCSRCSKLCTHMLALAPLEERRRDNRASSLFTIVAEKRKSNPLQSRNKFFKD